MKAIIIPNIASPESCTLVGDSAIGRDAMPLFLPAGEWTATPLWIFRIGRLGKSIAPKFALRYVEGCSIAILLAPKGEQLPGWIGFMDSAITPGRWMQLEAANTAAEAHILDTEVRLSPIDMDTVAQAVALITDKGTIKTGDVFLLPAPESVSTPIAPDTVITASIGTEEVLHLKIK